MNRYDLRYDFEALGSFVEIADTNFQPFFKFRDMQKRYQGHILGVNRQKHKVFPNYAAFSILYAYKMFPYVSRRV